MRLIRFFPCLTMSLAGLLMPLPSAPAQFISRQAAVDHVAADRTALLEGVQEIAAPGAPGGVTALGPAAFAVIGGKDGKALGPVVAATRFEKGRVVAFGHNGYFGALAENDTGTLLLNAARWAASSAGGKVKQKLRIAVVKQEGLAAWLKEKGYQTESVSGEGWQRRIAGADVLCCDAHDLSSGRDGGLDDLTRFVKSGGGLIIAATGWGWESGAKGKSLASDFAGNQLLAPMGLVFNNSTPDKTTRDGFRAGSDLALADASHALVALLEKPAKTDEARQAQISATLGLAVPSDSIRQLRNPTELMELWDQIVAAEDWLASTEDDRKRPERIVADVEISAGYMHSGYPIITYLDVVPMVSDLNAMRRGSWGHFHKLGHNHQQGDWTPDGTGEVTCNIFTLYVFDKVCGIPAEKAREGFSKEEIRQSVRKHRAEGGTFEHWKSDAFLSLIIHVQLQQGFGWETFRKVLAE